MRVEIATKKQNRLILAFNLFTAEFGLDISCVREVLKPQKIHPLPNAPAFVEGVINLRGHIIAVMDLRKKFNIKTSAESPRTRIIICRIKNFITGLIVDNVSEVISLSQDDITPSPQVASIQSEDNYVSGIANLEGRVITLLDSEKILTKEDFGKFSEIRE
jgi:purine-binding chemotaxis protein CheW